MSEGNKPPKPKFTDVELETIFNEKIVIGATSIAETNKKAIFRDLKKKLQTQFDGKMKVNFTAELDLTSNNEMTIKMGCKYDIKATHSDSLPMIEIKPDNQPDMFDEEDGPIDFVDSDTIKELEGCAPLELPEGELMDDSEDEEVVDAEIVED